MPTSMSLPRTVYLLHDLFWVAMANIARASGESVCTSALKDVCTGLRCRNERLLQVRRRTQPARSPNVPAPSVSLHPLLPTTLKGIIKLTSVLMPEKDALQAVTGSLRAHSASGPLQWIRSHWDRSSQAAQAPSLAAGNIGMRHISRFTVQNITLNALCM